LLIRLHTDHRQTSSTF